MAKKATPDDDIKKMTPDEDAKKTTPAKSAKKTTPVDKIDDTRVKEDDVYEIDLVDLLLTLWKRKLIILATIVIFAVFAVAYILVKPRLYESRATVAFLPVDSKTAPQSVSLTADTYLVLATSDDLLNDVMKEMSSSEPDKNVPSVSTLSSGLHVKFVETSDKTRRNVEPKAMIATFRSRNPETAMKVLSAWSRLFVQKTGQFSADKSGASLESVGRAVENAKKDLETLETNLLAYEKENPISLMEIQLKAKGETYSKLLAQHAAKSAELAPLDAEAKAAANMLAKEPQTMTLSRGMSNEALWNVVAQSSGRAAKFDPKQFNVNTEIENPLYRKFKEQSANAEIKATSDRVAIRDLGSRIDKAQKEYAELNAQILTAKTEIERLSQEKTTLQKSYSSLLEQYQNLRVASENNVVPLKVIENPVIPHRPVSRGGRKILCLASLLGLFVGTTLALLTELIARRKKVA